MPRPSAAEPFFPPPLHVTQEGRKQLLSCCLTALQEHVQQLPDSTRQATPEDWRLISTALTLSCSAQGEGGSRA